MDYFKIVYLLILKFYVLLEWGSQGTFAYHLQVFILVAVAVCLDWQSYSYHLQF